MGRRRSRTQGRVYIPLDASTRNQLDRPKRKGETWDGLIRRLMRGR